MSFLTELPRELYSKDAFSDFQHGQQKFDLGTAKAMAWMCQLAYETSNPSKIGEIAKDWGLSMHAGCVISEEVVTILPKASTQVIVAERNSTTIIVFAGTDPLVLADWISDFDFGITKAGTAAQGFRIAAEAVWTALRNLLETSMPREKIIVAGHSLGGALAVLTADKIHGGKLGHIDSVYTFGMPRAGDAEYATAYNQVLGLCTYRLVHGDDVVPTVAPSFLGFRHVGRILRCARGSKFDERELATAFGSDDPQFVKGISERLRGILHNPSLTMLSIRDRVKLGAALALGIGPSGMRRDPGGVIIELLPPPLRDHMPDCYLGALSVA